jgi:hypothetical protein
MILKQNLKQEGQNKHGQKRQDKKERKKNNRNVKEKRMYKIFKKTLCQ